MKAYKVKLNPTAKQIDKLELALDVSRQTYNNLLGLFSSTKEGYTESELKSYLLDLKENSNELSN